MHKETKENASFDLSTIDPGFSSWIGDCRRILPQGIVVLHRTRNISFDAYRCTIGAGHASVCRPNSADQRHVEETDGTAGRYCPTSLRRHRKDVSGTPNQTREDIRVPEID